ncbi:MAG TPA: ABC transporter ATP-binding protein [Nocardioidaceae bacterium]|nr:ABC transporter ATP-binding protein [Nocardioidaceae bacterium]
MTESPELRAGGRGRRPVRTTAAAVWLVLSTAVRVSRWRTVVALLETAAMGLQVLYPLFLAWFIAGVIERNESRLITAVIGFSASVTLTVILQLVGNTYRINLREEVGFEFDSRIAEMTATVPTLDHLESPRYLDELQMLRDEQSALGDSLNGIFNVFRDLTFIVGTVLLAATADPRMLLVAVAGLPNVFTSAWSIRWEAAAEKASAEPGRLATHLVAVATTTLGAAELRVFDLADPVRRRLRTAVGGWRRPFLTLQVKQGTVAAVNALLFFGTSVAVLAWMLGGIGSGQVSVSGFVLALLLVGRLEYTAQGVQRSLQTLSRTVRTAGRYQWLTRYAERVGREHPGAAEPPDRLRKGIRVEGLGYRYPEADRAALTGVTLDLPAGSVVALVGENGAGKSTLVKLLTGMYRPTEGRVLVDGTDLATLDVELWRRRTSGAFQDHARFELPALQVVGVGDLPLAHDERRVRGALEAAASTAVLDALPDGLATQLGPAWPGGVDLSGGQWQRLAIGRGMMRVEPLLLVLDEPTAALDAPTEHALFERFTAAARTASRRGAVTLLVTHRFSTVAAADVVVVLDGGQVAEVGTHADLVAAGGHYAELYNLQARGYR